MNKKVLNTLEYDKIVEQLAKLAGSDGRQETVPLSDTDDRPR